MTLLRLQRALPFMNMAPALEFLVFMSVTPAPELSFFITWLWGSAPASVHFYMLIFSNFNCLGVPQIEWKMKYT